MAEMLLIVTYLTTIEAQIRSNRSRSNSFWNKNEKRESHDRGETHRSMHDIKQEGQ